MNNQLEEKKEIWFMNYMKFFGVFYLLIYHSAIKQLNIFVILFFLQMFIFISGYFYKDKYTQNPGLFIKKRIRSLYLPFIIYCSLFLFLNNFFVDIKVYKPGMLLNNEMMWDQFLSILKLRPRQQMAGAMWFVSSLLITSTLFCLLSFILKFISKKQRTYLLFFCIAAIFMSGIHLSVLKIQIHPYIDISFVLLIFFYGGYLFKKNEDKIPINIYLAVTSFLMLRICMEFGFPQIPARRYINPPFLLMTGFAGIYLNIYISKKLAEFKKIKLLNYIGQNTLAILALHFLSFKVINLLAIYCFNLPFDQLASFPIIKSTSQYWRWLYVLAGLSIPVVLKSIFNLAYIRVVNIRGQRIEDVENYNEFQ
ncbi:MAG: acyltransferase family protein [Desulfobacula sp.]|nr:acyltransferase family protein [Desulfobacula sp.]